MAEAYTPFSGISKTVAQPNTTQAAVDAGTAAQNNPDYGLTDQQMWERRNGGLTRTTSSVDTGIGGQKPFHTYSVKPSSDPTYADNKNKLNSLSAAIAARQNQTMQGASAQGAMISTDAQNQMRQRQQSLLAALEAASAGRGPSAAQAQLAMGADRNMANALAMAEAGGGSPAAMRAAAFQQAAATQDLAGQSAMLRAQEMNDARGLLANTLQGARGQDIGLATNQAQLSQQAGQFNAGLAQDAGKTNLLAAIEQQRQRDELVARYTAAGMSLDQAQFQAQKQLEMFNADLLARQQAAQLGLAMQGSQQLGQVLGAGMQSGGAVLASGLDAASRAGGK